ncbi:hypothetical protein LCGC14_1432030 [marine sediment metagenome]|uniref:thermospermine synthase n=1 Tax=marine sediment metagenome TaxID=412755 RepID=A0A0F9K9I8_9ZZZZ
MNDTLTNLKTLYQEKSDYADIKIYETEDGRIILTLDTFIQFIEGKDEEIYHKILTFSPLRCNPIAKDFLILGGGDGLVAREILKYCKDSTITLVDLDYKVISLCMKNERIRKLNEDSLKFCNIIIDNALTWVSKCKEKFDIIICDFPDPNSPELEKLYTEDFYKEINLLLRKGGIIRIQTHSDITDKISEIIKKILGNSEIIKYSMPFLSDGAIVLGKNV